MRKFSKQRLFNIFWIVLILLVLFTPVGFHAKVYLNRLLLFTASFESETHGTIGRYDWQLHRLEGASLNFNEYQGEVVILNYWATWCPPCIAEMPSLVELHQNYGKEVRFIFLAKDEKEKVLSYLAKKRYKIPVFFSNQPFEKLQAASLPTTYIIDASGEVVLKKIGAANWNSKEVTDLIDDLLLKKSKI